MHRRKSSSMVKQLYIGEVVKTQGPERHELISIELLAYTCVLYKVAPAYFMYILACTISPHYSS